MGGNGKSTESQFKGGRIPENIPSGYSIAYRIAHSSGRMGQWTGRENNPGKKYKGDRGRGAKGKRRKIVKAKKQKSKDRENLKELWGRWKKKLRKKGGFGERSATLLNKEGKIILYKSKGS